jgi:hypothetical protein
LRRGGEKMRREDEEVGRQGGQNTQGNERLRFFFA